GGAAPAVKRAAAQAGAVPAYARGGLTIGAPHSPQEREAEAVGRAVKSGAPAPGIGGAAPPVQRAPKEDQRDQAKPVARAAMPATGAERQAPVRRAEKIKPTEPPVQLAAKPEAREPVRRAPAPEKQARVLKAAAPLKQEMPVQKAPAPEKQAPVLKAAAHQKQDMPVRKAPAERHGAPDPEPEVARAAVAGGGEGAAGGDAAQAMAAARAGEAQPLPPATRAVLEGSLAADLSAVRLHAGPAAQQAAALLQARAMTQGSDIFLGHGESAGDLELMGHEVAHVLQQGGDAAPQVQRAPLPGAPAAPAAPAPPDAASDPSQGLFVNGKLGRLKMKSKTEVESVELAEIEMFGFKATLNSAPLTLKPETRKQTEARHAANKIDTQSELWEKALAANGKAIQDAIRKKGDDAQQTVRRDPDNPATDETSNPRVFFFSVKGAKGQFHLVGTDAEIAQRALRPWWNAAGALTLMEVDHKKELQLGGDHGPANFWLLDRTANGESGRGIDREVRARVNALRDSAQAAFGKAYTVPGYNKLRYNDAAPITVAKVTPKGTPSAGPFTWELGPVGQAEPIKSLEPLPQSEIEKLGGKAGQLSLFTNRLGGSQLSLPYDKAKGAVTQLDALSLAGFQATSLTYASPGGGEFKGRILPRKGSAVTPKELTIPVAPMPGLRNAAVLDTKRIPAIQTEVPGASPFTLTTIEFRAAALYARGEIKPTLPLLANTMLAAEFDGGELRLEAELSPGELSIPGPVRITNSSLAIIAGTDGIGARGSLALEIDRVGRGVLEASAGTVGVALSGSFEFDTSLFSQASLKAWYKAGEFGADGTLSIAEGKIKGIKAATIKAHYDKDRLSAEGEVTPSIPAVKDGKLKVEHAAETGLSIAGDLTLGTIPGFSGGTLKAALAQKGEAWSVKAAGSLTPAIPGIAGEVAAQYEDGGFLARGTLGFAKGMLSGTATIGASNQAVGPDGVPAGPPTDRLTLFGGGSATLRLAPWLQATAGLTFHPDGQVAVDGSIGLPAAIDLFEAKRLDKDLFKIGLDIPILGFAVAGQRVGIFANITGGAQVGAGIGPGQLTDLSLSVHYNPAREEETEVKGTAHLTVPADAGLRVFVRAGIGAGLPLISVQGGLEAGGRLGLEGALRAGVDIDWRPGKGLAIEAAAELFAEPKLRFDLSGFALVEADLFVTSIELYKKTWALAALEMGSGLRLGVKFPLRYEEGKPFSLALSDVEFTVPQIDPMATIGKVIDQVV
ncbi:DUF4157 domain-containing protein, partial [Paracraurococcus ruber]|uniref:eCIS core domain-containing protein n=2 Tax=Paracraurococcus ruber TaxID=77675 RepID=UPI001057EBE8